MPHSARPGCSKPPRRIAAFLHASSRREGLEHDSNFVPWYAMCREILPKFGRRVSYRLARFDARTGELDRRRQLVPGNHVDGWSPSHRFFMAAT